MIRSLCAALFWALIGAGGLAAQETAPRAEFLAAYLWRDDIAGFGGFSGLELAEDGRSFWAVSDGGLLVSGQLQRAAGDGPVSGVVIQRSAPLTFPDGRPLQGIWNDAEALALAPDGTLMISFEGKHRIWRQPDVARSGWAPGKWEELPPHPDFADLQNNSSLECLAVAPDGAVVTVPERSGLLSRPYPAYRFANGQWLPDFALTRRPPHLVAGCDFGPDGRFYLLERHLNGFFGFQSRVRSWHYGPDGFTDEQLVLSSASAAHDNLEGLAVWRDAAGDIRLTLISDDNFRAFQRTEIVEYRLPR